MSGFPIVDQNVQLNTNMPAQIANGFLDAFNSSWKQARQDIKEKQAQDLAAKERQHKEAIERADLVSNVAATLAQYPEAERPARLAALKPVLAPLGLDDATLGQIDLSDAGLKGYQQIALDTKTRLEMSKGVVVGNNLVNPYSAKEMYKGDPKLQSVTDPITGRTTVFNPYTGKFGRAAVEGGDSAASVGGEGAPAAGSLPQGGGFENAVSVVLKNEGGYAPRDANGAPVNFGINQGANPDLDVKNLTRDQAIQIYHDRYWVPSGAENLPANLQAPYFDAYVRSPKRAKFALEQSGGDPQKFMQMMGGYFQGLAQSNPGKYGRFAHAWANRDANNTAIAGGQASDAPTAPYYPEDSNNGSVQRAPVAGRSYNKEDLIQETGMTADQADQYLATGKDPRGSLQGAQMVQASAPADDPYSFGGDAKPTVFGQPQPGSYGYIDAKGVPHMVQNPPKSNSDDGGTGLSSDSVEQLARDYLISGKMPPLGMGKAAAASRNAILNRAAEIAGANGQGGRSRTQAFAQYRALTGTAQKLEQVKGPMQASERGAIANGQLALDIAKKRSFVTPSPLINGIAQKVGVQGLGSEDLAAMHAAFETFAVEYGKVMSGNGMGGQALTDSAAAHARELLNEGYNNGQLEAVMKTLRADMHNRIDGVNQQLGETYGRINSMDAHTAAKPQQSKRPPVNIPAGAIQMLRSNPALADKFDEKYGAGSAAKILGAH